MLVCKKNKYLFPIIFLFFKNSLVICINLRIFATKSLFMKQLVSIILVLFVSFNASAKIDRKALLERNNPHITAIDTMASLSVGNGEFAFTCDVTGLQTFHNLYSHGVPLGTMSQWGWHSFPNTEGYNAKEVLKASDFGRGHEEWYSCQFKEGRLKDACNYLRANPHRLHLGIIGFEGINPQDVKDINQTLNLWDGLISSSFKCNDSPMKVVTQCCYSKDMVIARINDKSKHNVQILFPYPTGAHSDDACDWSKGKDHSIELITQIKGISIFRHKLDGQSYYIKIGGNNIRNTTIKDGKIVITPQVSDWTLCVEFTKDIPTTEKYNTENASASAIKYWNNFWTKGGAVDFSRCTDPRAKELERRTVLSQYLLAIQCAGSTPPQETGLTYNSWFGKFHLEMIWWHMSHFALWGHPDILERTLRWYEGEPYTLAKEIAKRQGFEGVRWMKMTDPSGMEAPSNTGSFLIWQQPHFIYLAELIYRCEKQYGINKEADALIKRYSKLVFETADFMASFATYDAEHDRYVLKGCIPAQETLRAADTVNPPFELSYWYYALNVAQEWRVRSGMERSEVWDKVIKKLSPLCAKDGVYSAAETAPSYPSILPQKTEGTTTMEAEEIPENLRMYSDHMAVLAACGVLPFSPQYDVPTMKNTLEWVMKNWNWDKTWGWDYPTTCMTAVRLGEAEMAIDALLMDKRTNTYLPNGHNYQDKRLRCYLPGNGGMLTALALMCAGFDGCETMLPGFPKNGKWDVEYEGILRLP